MKKTLLYIAIAIVLGLLMTLIPTWLFLVEADEQGKLTETFGRRLPFLGPSERNHVEPISTRDVETLGISFIIASIIYVLFRRKTPRRNYIWPPTHPY